MEPSGQKSVVIDLIRIPSVCECRRSQTGQRDNRTLRSGLTHRNRLRRPCLSRVPCHRIEGFERRNGNRTIPVVAHPETIEKNRTESMVFFEGGNLPLGGRRLQDIVKSVRLCQGRIVVHIRPEEAVLPRYFLVDSNGEIIFADNLLPYEFV